MKDKKIVFIVSLIAIFVVMQFFFMRPSEKQESDKNTEATISTETSSSTTPEL